MTTKREPTRLMTPVGRLINSSLWEKDVFRGERGGEGKPSYKVEMAFEPAELGEFEAAVAAEAVAEWGPAAEDAYWDGEITSPVLEGDKLADGREAKGKVGDAYRGKLVVRAKTVFNRNGEDGPGGVYVCDEDAKELDFANRGKVYNGCFGRASVTLQAGKVQDRYVTAYLNGFQFVKDGDRLRTSDPGSLFSPMMGEKSEAKGRRRRG